MSQKNLIGLFTSLIFATLLLSNFGIAAADSTRHIIVFDGAQSASETASALQADYALDDIYLYDTVLNGMSVIASDATIAQLQADPRVAFVEADALWATAAQEIPTGIRRINAASNQSIGINSTGPAVDVDVAILDSGIDTEHPDLNVVGGTNCVRGTANYCGPNGSGGNYDDRSYHGTHVAGIVGALDNDIGVVGVAPGARLWAVKVMNGESGALTADVVAAIEWVVERGDIEVINLSLYSGGYSPAYEQAINNAVANGVTVVVAAGNENRDAIGYGPANIPAAITVSAIADYDGLPGSQGTNQNRGEGGCPTYTDDSLAGFSNWGSIIDIAAPGIVL
ncbi:MAG: S8 family serine peptidase [Chloroflexota bacterium]